MDYAAEFTALAREELSFVDYTSCFCQLGHQTLFNDETLKSLFWIGANYYGL